MEHDYEIKYEGIIGHNTASFLFGIITGFGLGTMLEYAGQGR